jgi:hypothetical protein
VVVLLAMTAAEGTSVLRNVYVINRGYEDLAECLNSVGAQDRDVPGHLTVFGNTPPHPSRPVCPRVGRGDSVARPDTGRTVS